MMDFTIGQYAVLALSAMGLIAGLMDRRGKFIERLFLIAAGLCVLLLDIGLNFAASALSMIQSRSVGEILLFLRAPPGDVLMPVGYVLIAIGIGSVARKLADRVLVVVRRNGN